MPHSLDYTLPPLDIPVLMGGDSRERTISLRSGFEVTRALVSLGHRARPVDITSEHDPLDLYPADVCFLALHGGFGEGGIIQSRLEARGVPYTGSGPRASRLALEKVRAKERFRAAGLPCAPERVFNPASPRAAFRAVAALGGPPVVFKPVAEGSSIGVEIIRKEQEIGPASARLATLGVEAMAEPFVAGRELTVGILGREPLPPIELKPAREFFDYVAKYQDAGTEYVIDPTLPDGVREAVQRIALGAHDALGCRGMSRVDIILGAEGPIILEVNTIPGFTPKSLLPKAARAAGIEFPKLCELIAAIAIAETALRAAA